MAEVAGATISMACTDVSAQVVARMAIRLGTPMFSEGLNDQTLLRVIEPIDGKGVPTTLRPAFAPPMNVSSSGFVTSSARHAGVAVILGCHRMGGRRSGRWP
jgi:hypothetical protein